MSKMPKAAKAVKKKAPGALSANHQSAGDEKRKRELAALTRQTSAAYARFRPLRDDPGFEALRRLSHVAAESKADFDSLYTVVGAGAMSLEKGDFVHAFFFLSAAKQAIARLQIKWGAFASKYQADFEPRAKEVDEAWAEYAKATTKRAALLGLDEANSPEAAKVARDAKRIADARARAAR